MYLRHSVLALAVLAKIILVAPAAHAEKPLWELGVGVGWLNYPSWRGATSRSVYAAPLPFFVWRGERLRADRDGVRGILVERSDLSLELSADAMIPVDSDDDDARKGMEDLDPILELGPTLKWRFHNFSAGRMLLRTPVRAAFSVSPEGVSHQGWTFAPTVRFESTASPGRFSYSVGLGPRFASEEYHAYFYDVQPEYARLDRPEYQSTGGYSGTAFMVSGSRRFGRFWAGMFARYEYLGGAAFTESPLAESRHVLMVGAALHFVLAASKQSVSRLR